MAILCLPGRYQTWPIGTVCNSVPVQVSESWFSTLPPFHVVDLSGYGVSSFHYTRIPCMSKNLLTDFLISYREITEWYRIICGLQPYILGYQSYLYFGKRTTYPSLCARMPAESPSREKSLFHSLLSSHLFLYAQTKSIPLMVAKLYVKKFNVSCYRRMANFSGRGNWRTHWSQSHFGALRRAIMFSRQCDELVAKVVLLSFRYSRQETNFILS